MSRRRTSELAHASMSDAAALLAGFWMKRRKQLNWRGLAYETMWNERLGVPEDYPTVHPHDERYVAMPLIEETRLCHIGTPLENFASSNIALYTSSVMKVE